MQDDDVTPLVLSIVSLTVLTLVLGIILVPVWSPEGIVVLGAGGVVLALASDVLGLRSAFRRREFVWIVLIVLLGPVGVLGYSLLKATESGVLASYMEELANQVVGHAADQLAEKDRGDR